MKKREKKKEVERKKRFKKIRRVKEGVRKSHPSLVR